MAAMIRPGVRKPHQAIAHPTRTAGIHRRMNGRMSAIPSGPTIRSSRTPVPTHVADTIAASESAMPPPSRRSRHRGPESACHDESTSFLARKGLTVPKAVTLIRSASLADRAEYAYAATAPADARLIFLAGSCPLDADGSTVGVGDYVAQEAACIRNMITALAESGATIADVISTRVLVASSQRSDLVTAWEVVRDAFGEHDVPSSLLGVTVLGYADQLVEIEAVAAVID